MADELTSSVAMGPTPMGTRVDPQDSIPERHG